MTIVLGFWVIPLLISIVAFVWWLFILKEDSGGYMPGLGAMLLLPFVGFGICFVWLVYFVIMYVLK